MQELKCYSCSGEIRKWIERIFPFRIYDGYPYWYTFRNGMMISYDHVYRKCFCISYRLDITSSTVDRDDERDQFFLEFIEKIFFQAIAIMDAMRKSVRNCASDLREKSDEYSSTRNSIDIVVSEDHDAFPFLSCYEYSFDRYIHIWHEIWIMEMFDRRLEKCIIFDFSIGTEDLKERSIGSLMLDFYDLPTYAPKTF